MIHRGHGWFPGISSIETTLSPDGVLPHETSTPPPPSTFTRAGSILLQHFFQVEKRQDIQRLTVPTANLGPEGKVNVPKAPFSTLVPPAVLTFPVLGAAGSFCPGESVLATPQPESLVLPYVCLASTFHPASASDPRVSCPVLPVPSALSFMSLIMLLTLVQGPSS